MGGISSSCHVAVSRGAVPNANSGARVTIVLPSSCTALGPSAGLCRPTCARQWSLLKKRECFLTPSDSGSAMLKAGDPLPWPSRGVALDSVLGISMRWCRRAGADAGRAAFPNMLPASRCARDQLPLLDDGLGGAVHPPYFGPGRRSSFETVDPGSAAPNEKDGAAFLVTKRSPLRWCSPGPGTCDALASPRGPPGLPKVKELGSHRERAPTPTPSRVSYFGPGARPLAPLLVCALLMNCASPNRPDVPNE